MKNKVKKIATWIIVPLMAAIFILDIVTVALSNKYAKKYYPVQETFTYENGDDRIHFLNTANSDAILLESNGHFALVDAGEGNNNPRRKTPYKGYEQEVVDYIRKVAGDSAGENATLDFVLATHYHYDHVGCFHAVITDAEINIGKAFLKDFNYDVVKDYEVENWEIDDIYFQMVDDLKSRNVTIINKLPTEPFEFGDFILQFYNTVTPAELSGEGENASSVGVKVTKGSKSAFLAADITKSCGLEQILADSIGEIDLLKIGHHGYFGSSSSEFLEKLSPKIAIVTNHLGKVYPNVKWNLIMKAKLPLYATYDCNGIIANFDDNGDIVLTGNIH